MKPLWVIILVWILLVPRVRAARRGNPEEAAFYYGTFPPGTSIPLPFCPQTVVYQSICLSLMAFLPWLACQGIRCFGFWSGGMENSSMWMFKKKTFWHLDVDVCVGGRALPISVSMWCWGSNLQPCQC